ncbi:unnamed protein product [Penicillium bialowiezense]
MRAIQAKGKRTRRVSFSNLIRGRRAPGDVPTECPGTESCNRAIEAIQGKDGVIELAEFIVESLRGLPQRIEASGNSEAEIARGITQEPLTPNGIVDMAIFAKNCLQGLPKKAHDADNSEADLVELHETRLDVLQALRKIRGLVEEVQQEMELAAAGN